MATATPAPAPAAAKALTTPAAPAAEDKGTEPATKGFVVQIGVFTSYNNAEALRQKLKESGIEARTETRVQLGPFTDRAQAEAAMEKIRSLGIRGVLVPQR